MQIKSLRIKSYSSFKIDGRKYSELAKKRLKLLKNFEKLRKSGCKEVTALEILDLSRSKLYRLKKRFREEGLLGLENKSKSPRNKRVTFLRTRELNNLVKKIRKENPTWGKIKIHKIITRDYYIQASESTIGRIISELLKNKKISPAYIAANKNKPKRKRIFNKHAKKWKYGMKGKSMGEMIQIDHMSVYSDSKGVKHFKAVCPISRFMVCKVYNTATSSTAAKFLKEVISGMPFKIISIQVDGGSEFMKHFEVLCQELDIKLFVLPPKSPKYNGKVERCNGVTRDEFYSQYKGIFNTSEINLELNGYQNKYNSYRPHQGINNLTPLEYISVVTQNRAA